MIVNLTLPNYNLTDFRDVSDITKLKSEIPLPKK